MNCIFTTLTFIFFSTLLSAQSFWAQGTGGNDVDETMDMCFDNAGNIVSAGYFTNSAAFGSSTTLTSASGGIPDIYVSKSNSSGVIQWAVRAGDYGSDRALSVKTDASGNIYITGFYNGAATFGSITLNSSNGSQDIFIAKLNSAGTFIWAVSAGGNMADIGNAMDVDVNGNVLVTGQFQDSATFGTSTLVSMINPQTTVSSIDVFTAKYDNSGNFLWVRQGAAEYTDRGLDIAADTSGNIFVCGQFSDTIIFNQVHNNTVTNAIFLIKYDANGNEIWFRKASGAYSIPYSLVINSNQDIYMTGDYQGTLAFYGPPNNLLSDTYSQCVYLVKYGNNGNFIWAQSESSSNYISARAVTLGTNGDPYIAGEFGCTLNEYADIFGQGTFNSIGYQDIFTVKYNSSGQRLWMRNFGGHGNDKAHSILVKADNIPIIAGSYEKDILWAVNTISLTTNNPWTWGSSGNSSYCSDLGYGNFRAMGNFGFSDGFIAKAVDINRQPYDYYHRTGTSCLRGFVGGCIDNALTFTCPDTLTFCGTGTLYANTYTGSGLLYSAGPEYHFQWSSSPLDLYTITINSTNYYSVKMTTFDGCYTSEDSIYAIVNPIPQAPTITDDHGVNNQQPQWGIPIAACQPDSVLLVAGNINGNSLTWNYSSFCYPGGTFQTSNDSLYVSTSGSYNAVLTNQYGCINYNCVNVQLDSLLPPLLPVSQIPDTLVACSGDFVILNVIDSLTGVAGPFNSFMNSWTSSPALVIYLSSNSLNGWFFAQTSGTYIVNDSIVYINQCDTQYYSVQDTFYLLVNPKPTVTVSITGPNYFCQGDTIILHITYTPSYTVNTVMTTNPVIDSIIVTQAGYYSAYAVITDTVSGCSSWGNVYHQVQIYPNPVLSTDPFSGLICPNDSVEIICNTAGTNYQWIGPNGTLPFNTQSIYQSVPGFYYCFVTNMDGCVLTSNTIELKQYNTPYLLPTPSSVVCNGESVTLHVITNDTTLIQWNPPLSGGGTTQVVTQTGVYSCYVTMCGITTLCSITVSVSQAAQITGPDTICPGDSALLVANSGMANYQWWPITSNNDSVYVQAGTYTLTTTDANGCTASATATVTLDTLFTQPSANDISVCAGTTATLFASGVGQMGWYTSLTSTTPVYTGNPFTTPPINTQTTYYLEATSSAGCHSLRDSVTIFITTTSLPPSVSADTLVCGGDSITFSTFYQPNATYSWTGPNGFASSSQNPFILNASSVNSGTYTLVVSGNNCTSPPVTINVSVISPVTPIVSGTNTVCDGDSILLNVTNPVSNTIYSWNGPLGFSSTGTSATIFPAAANNSGTYTVYGSINGCTSAIASFNVFVKPEVPPVTASSNSPICSGDSLQLFSFANGNFTYSWTGPSGFSSAIQNPVITPADTTNSGTYIVASVLNGCSGNPYYLNVVVNPNPILYLGPDTAICNNQPLLLSPSGNYFTYLWYDNATTNNHLIDSAGLYSLVVTNVYGCSDSDFIQVSEMNCGPAATNVFTPNGDGINDEFNFAGRYFKKSQCEIFDRWGRKIYAWDDPNGGWDGTNIRTKRPVSDGTYYYVAHITDFEGKEITLAGFVTLLR